MLKIEREGMSTTYRRLIRNLVEIEFGGKMVVVDLGRALTGTMSSHQLYSERVARHQSCVVFFLKGKNKKLPIREQGDPRL